MNITQNYRHHLLSWKGVSILWQPDFFLLRSIIDSIISTSHEGEKTKDFDVETFVSVNTSETIV